MALKIFVHMCLFLIWLLFPKSDCIGIGTVSTTRLAPTTTTTARPYPGCGVKLDFEVGATIVGGWMAEKNAYPWMVFLYNYDRDLLGMDVMNLDLPKECKPNTTTTIITTTPTTSQFTNVSVPEDTNLKMSVSYGGFCVSCQHSCPSSLHQRCC